jgi:hypothetical protein
MVCSKSLIIANLILKVVVIKDLSNWTKIDAINVKHVGQEHNTMLLLIHASVLHQNQCVLATKSSKLDLTNASNVHLVNSLVTLLLTKLEDARMLVKPVMPEVKYKEARINAMLVQLVHWVKHYRVTHVSLLSLNHNAHVTQNMTQSPTLVKYAKMDIFPITKLMVLKTEDANQPIKIVMLEV